MRSSDAVMATPRARGSTAPANRGDVKRVGRWLIAAAASIGREHLASTISFNLKDSIK